MLSTCQGHTIIGVFSFLLWGLCGGNKDPSYFTTVDHSLDFIRNYVPEEGTCTSEGHQGSRDNQGDTGGQNQSDGGQNEQGLRDGIGGDDLDSDIPFLVRIGKDISIASFIGKAQCGKTFPGKVARYIFTNKTPEW